jgi:hypothetical protein
MPLDTSIKSVLVDQSLLVRHANLITLGHKHVGYFVPKELESFWLIPIRQRL